jgi:pantetheine-phosphate adenylyltransferase
MKACYAGSFDPHTLGHLDVIARAAPLVDELVVAIGFNPQKTPYLPLEQRISLLTEDCKGLPNVTVTSFSGATVHFAKAIGAQCLVRGLRSSADLTNEQGMAEVNRKNGFETIFLLAESSHANLSSSLVRQVLTAGLSLEGLVSDAVAAALAARV